MDIPVFGNTIQIMYARVTRPLEQRAPLARVIYSKGRLCQTNVHAGWSLRVEGCKTPALVSPEDDASDGEGDPASDPPHEEDDIGDDI